MTTLTSNAVHWQCYLDHTRYICIKNLKNYYLMMKRRVVKEMESV